MLHLSSHEDLKVFINNTPNDPTVRFNDCSRATSRYGQQFLPDQPHKSSRQVKESAELVPGGIYRIKKLGFEGKTSLLLMLRSIDSSGVMIFSGFNLTSTSNEILFHSEELCLASGEMGWTNWCWIEEV